MTTITTPIRTSTRLGGLVVALALTLGLALGLGASRADAQPGAQLAAPFPALTLTYTDAQGPGTATFTPQGVDPATGGTAIAVTISQAGGTFSGAGFVRQVDARDYIIAFTVTSEYGESYFLAGTLARGDDVGDRRGHQHEPAEHDHVDPGQRPEERQRPIGHGKPPSLGG